MSFSHLMVATRNPSIDVKMQAADVVDELRSVVLKYDEVDGKYLGFQVGACS